MPPPLNSFFHPAPGGGQRLYLHHAPPAGQVPRGAVLHVHPWAEEMNKSRRMAAMTSRALAAAGWAVLQHDLLGCGDSSGDFADASWDAWIDDVTRAAQWLQACQPGAPLWLWGHRAGALLAAAAADRLNTPVDLLLWQPTPQGRAVLQQFLRLKAAAQLADGGGKAILEAARADLAASQPVEVAGYTLAPALARGLEQASLAPPVPRSQMARAVWLETSAQPDPAVSPAARIAAARWQAAGWRVDLRAVNGPAFWQTTEIEDAPALVDATVAALQAACDRSPTTDATPAAKPADAQTRAT